MIDIQPLDATRYDLIDAETTKPEHIWRRVLLVGSFISTMLWEKRNRPLFEEYCRVLESRPEIPPEVWGDEPRQEVASAICHAAKSEIGWPGERFIPSDPIRVALWSFHDSLDAEEAISLLAETLQVKVRMHDLIPIWNSDLSGLIDHILSLPKES